MVIDGLLVLGALEARDRGRPLPIGAPRTRTLLALLLTPPNTLVSVDRLVDELWPEQAPPEARDLVHGYVSRLRRSLRAGSAADRLVTRRPGYLLRVEEHQLDRCRFERLLADARAGAEAGRLDESLSQYRQAGQLWRAARPGRLPLASRAAPVHPARRTRGGCGADPPAGTHPPGPASRQPVIASIRLVRGHLH